MAKTTLKRKATPKFKSENEEAAFWATHDSTEYIDWVQAMRIDVPNLKPSTKTVSLRLPEMLLHNLKTIANQKDVPYQSLMKMFLSEKVKEDHVTK